MNRHFFRQNHPFVTSSYYLLMLLVVMSTTNPVIISSCFLGSLLFRLFHSNKQRGSILYPLVILGVITVTNPLFVHRGGTILFFFLNKPITKEAFVYGFFMGMMIATVIYVFQNFQEAIDSEQFFYLFGQRLPKAALILSLVFRYIPMLQQYYQELDQVQKTMQRRPKRKIKERAAYGFDLFGNLFSWSLENAMDTADAMKARGYGVVKRSSRLNYRWRTLDTGYLFMIVTLGSLFLFFMVNERYQFDYYPYQENLLLTIYQHWLDYLVLFIFSFLPLLNRVKEVMVWHILKSKI